MFKSKGIKNLTLGLFVIMIGVGTILSFLPKDISAQSVDSLYSQEVEELNGESITLSKFDGKVLIIDVWATWCPPCRKAVPSLIELKNKYGENGFEVIGLSVDDNSDDVQEFVEEYGVNYPMYMATDGVLGYLSRLTEEKQIRGIPTMFVFDGNGDFKEYYVGYGSRTEKAIEQTVTGLLGIEKPESISSIKELTLAELEKYEGKIIFIDIWATWCPPCREAIPELIELYNEYKDDGLVVIGASVDDGPEIVEEYVEENDMNYPNYMYTEELDNMVSPLTEEGVIQYVPTLFIFDQNGEFINYYIGHTPKETLEEEISNMLE